MIQLLDGPAGGHMLLLRRAPHFLRVTIHRKTGEVDALDQLDDYPALAEDVHVYRLASKPTRYHMRRQGGSGCFVEAKYELYHTQPLDRVLRDNALWQQWANRHFEKRDVYP